MAFTGASAVRGCRVNDATLLYRQIHPSFYQQGRVTSQAFKPMPKDEGRLSVYNGEKISAQASWEHYTGELKLESMGVLAVTVAECTALQLPVDPDGKPFEAHASVVFRDLAASQIERKAKYLRKCAQERGWQYREAAA